MSGPRALLQDPATTDVDVTGSDSRYLRLSSCPNCAGRRRALVEVGNRLVGRCLGCGEELSVPLETEWQNHILIVGRAGQGVYGIDATGD
jgi:hypothetical protein